MRIVGNASRSAAWKSSPGAAALFALCLAVAAAAAPGLASCAADPSRWYPSGSAAVASWHERADGLQKTCAFTLKIANKGSSTINSYSVSLALATSARTYYTTVAGDFAILPGGVAFFDGEVAYASAEESLVAEGPAIVNEYYW